MQDLPERTDLLDHLVRTRGLERRAAAAIVDDVLAFLSETAADYVRRRHRELQAEGRDNRAIYACLRHELSHWRFRADALSERQVRRLIYG